ncbi:DEAD/DEAH box helicase family protein [Candidatus Enterococcus ferrettii]|uniref:Competence protein ComFA n=1 Tax=Candidatus Enterococcus ferrettii TaxID=2815324 RepID=A0ABV0EHQ9_9ENTE|nr:DEAD/DEAH box helicase family protein [Enterococcus sp. 665A]MBO1338586.1 DEAD/DEAH box helicase family protein [Enterococcus sp. 665A]
MNAYEGQRLLKSEWETFYPTVNIAKAQKIPAMNETDKEGRCCQRCGSTSSEQVPAGFYYCPFCISLGRISSNQFLYTFPVTPLTKRSVSCQWTGTLSQAQNEIAQQLVRDQSQANTFLIWAVTGAGKTEMLFPLIQDYLSQGKRIAVTSPRVDVCNELHLRFTQSFQQEKISLYHGSKRIDAGNQWIVCTIHQLFRYHHTFDLIILDEVDAFPYANNPFLEQAIARSKQSQGSIVYLSATPSKLLLRSVDYCYRLPGRYHRRQLPVPKVLLSLFLNKKLDQGKLPKAVTNELMRLLEKNDVLFFCPSIPLLEVVKNQLLDKEPNLSLTTVFANDEERLVKVENMRDCKYQILITTTILERGVTFEGVSVLILNASHQVFNKAALVQISGRADRKGPFREAEVCFVTSEWTRTIKQAVKEIEENNQLAREAGVIE